MRGTHGIYEVTGKTPFRGHLPGSTFLARMQPANEQRAIGRGAIRLVERVVPSLPERFQLPEGWAK